MGAAASSHLPTGPARMHLAHLPTPIESLERLSRELGCVPIDVKRDDLTGMLLSGNKVRKLEFLLAEAREQGATCLITPGGVQSNHARAVAAVASRLGLRCILLLHGAPAPPLAADRTLPPVESAAGSSAAEGNLFLDQLLGARVVSVTAAEYRDRDRVMAEIADRLRGQGEVPYVIPEGGSNALGAWGYAAMVEELLAQNPACPWDQVICAVGSGGTAAGLVIGAELLGCDLKVRGYTVHRGAEYFAGEIARICDAFSARFGVPLAPPAARMELVDGFQGPAYARTYPEEIDVIREVARGEGIVLDPVYTGKAFTGMVSDIRTGAIAPRSRVLFLHTGGLFGLLADRLAGTS